MSRFHSLHFAASRITRLLGAVLLFLTLYTSARGGSSNSLMDISADGALLACSNRDSGTVTVVDLKSQKKLRELKAGHKPEGVSFLGKSHRLAVASYADDRVIFLDADTGTALGKTEVFDEPYGIVSNTDGSRAYVSLSYPGQVLEIDTATFAVMRTFEGGAFARGIALTPDNRRLYVTEYYTANVSAIDVAAGKAVDHWNGISSDNLARQITLHPTRGKAYLSHIRSAVERAQGEGSIFPYVSVLDTKAAESAGAKRRMRIPMDSFTGTHVTANPWEVAISADGKRFVAVFSGTNEAFVCDVLNDDYREIKYGATLPLGNNPRAVRFSADGRLFYVYNALDFNVVAYDTMTLRKIASVDVTANPLGEEVLLGKKLFYSALQPMVGRRWISCASCHPDGEPDGRTWQNPEGLRNTQSLASLAWTHPIHWSADRDEVQDFEHTIRGQLMQGQGLIRGRVQPPLGTPNKGLSRELDALAAYSNTHSPTLSPHGKNGLNESAARGRELFFSKTTACATCHSGPYYTDSGSQAGRHDVGTGGDDPTEIMGSAYDTPTLLGVYRTAPYLHHGKATTLEEVLTKHNEKDRHGTTSQLSTKQVQDLVEFVKCLPYEDPEPEAKRLGLRKVER